MDACEVCVAIGIAVLVIGIAGPPLLYYLYLRKDR